jgi:hypothetical protein
MASNEPPPPGAADGPGDAGGDEPGGDEPGGGREAPPDALRRLEERLDRASGAAERLIAEAAAASAARAAGAFGRPPPAGWQAPKSSEDGDARGPELDILIQLLESLRELIPPDLQQRLVQALRELLLAVRALINWYLERLDGHREEPAEVQDIPIDWD